MVPDVTRQKFLYRCNKPKQSVSLRDVNTRAWNQVYGVSDVLMLDLFILFQLVAVRIFNLSNAPITVYQDEKLVCYSHWIWHWNWYWGSSGCLPFNLQKFAKKLLDDMLKQRIIELASGPWSFRCQTKMVHHAFMGLSSSEQSHQIHVTTPDTSVWLKQCTQGD